MLLSGHLGGSAYTDCNLRQGAKHLKGTYKRRCSYVFFKFVLGMFDKIFVFLSQNCVFWASPCTTMQNHLEISSKVSFWSPICLHNSLFSKIVLFYLQTTFFDGQTVFFRFLAEIRLRTLIKSSQKASSRPISCKFRRGLSPGWGPLRVGAHMGSYGPIYGPIWAFMGPYMGPYGPIWVLLDRSWKFRQLSVQISVRFPSDFWTNFARFGTKNGILMKFLNDCASFLLEKLKKHVILTNNLNIWSKIQKIPKRSSKIHKFLGFPRVPRCLDCEIWTKSTVEFRFKSLWSVSC